MRVLFSLQLKKFLAMLMSAEPGGKVPYSTDLRSKFAEVGFLVDATRYVRRVRQHAVFERK